MNVDNRCKICGVTDCDDDCEERRLIYRERQREMLMDCDFTEEELDAARDAADEADWLYQQSPDEEYYLSHEDWEVE